MYICIYIYIYICVGVGPMDMEIFTEHDRTNNKHQHVAMNNWSVNQDMEIDQTRLQ